MTSPDVIVLGLGGIGSAACASLARRGARVLGLDRYGRAHDHGSSHGESRLIRAAYFESPAYVPLVLRSFDAWRALEEATGRSLLHRDGLVLFGRRAPIARDIAERFAIEVESLDARAARARFPSLGVSDEHVALYEPGAGWLAVEACVLAHLEVAERAGAELRFETEVISFHADAAGVTVETRTESLRANKLVVAAGPWSPTVLASLGLPLTAHRVVQFWFDAPPDHDAPCFGYDLPEGFFYGFPRNGGRVKVAEHASGPLVSSPEAAAWEITHEDAARVEAFVRASLPKLGARVLGKRCFYTMTPDEHFIVDTHARAPNVAFAAGFSGHGFKFAPAIGEALADLAQRGATSPDMAFLRARSG